MDVIALTQQLIAFESTNPPGNEAKISQFLEGLLTDAGIETTSVPVKGHGDVLIAHLPGASRDGIIFTGHMDVVPVSDAEASRWTTNPFEGVLQEGRLYGRGSADMKGGLAAGVCALLSLKEQGITPTRDLFLVATVDEEDSMLGSKAVYDHPLLEDAREVVVMEPTKMALCTAGRGRTYGSLTFQGQTGHGSGGVSQGNAILLAQHFMEEMGKVPLSVHPTYGASFWQPVAIHAGVEPCVVPDHCTLKIDARLHPCHETADIWEKVDTILQHLQLKEQTYLLIHDRREGWETREGDFFHRMVSSMEEVGLPLSTDTFPGTTDGSIFRRKNREILIIGPGDLAHVHRENEFVDVAELLRAEQLYRALMMR